VVSINENDRVKLKYLENKSELLKAIAHPIRLCILNCLRNVGDCNVTELIEKLEKPQSTISQHLSRLRAAGIVSGERNGLEVQYSIINEDINVIVDLLMNDLTEQREV